MMIMFQKSHNNDNKNIYWYKKIKYITLKGNVTKKRNDLEFSFKFLAD